MEFVNLLFSSKLYNVENSYFLFADFLFPIFLQDRPSQIMGQTNILILKYATSVNNTGSWRAQFQFTSSGTYNVQRV